MVTRISGGPISGDASGTLSRAMGELLNISSDAKRVVAVLERILDTSTDADQTATDKRINALMTGPKGNNLKTNYEQIEASFKSLSSFKTESALAAYRSDINDIENIWEDIQDYKVRKLLFTTPPPIQVDFVTTNSVLSLFKELRREIAFFTIPKRTPDRVAETGSVGAGLDFHEAFENELPDAGDRLTVLRRIANLRPVRIGGVVDVEGGMIFRIGNIWQRLGSYALLLLTGVLGYFVLRVMIDQNWIWDPASGIETNLTYLYLVLMAGVMVHILKKATEFYFYDAKRGVLEKTGPNIGNLLLWVHVRQGRFLLAIVSAIAAFAILGDTAPGKLNWVSAFTTGYVVDSLSDLIFQRFNTAVSAQAKDLTKVFQLKG